MSGIVPVVRSGRKRRRGAPVGTVSVCLRRSEIVDDLRDERSDAQVVVGDEAPLADDRCVGAVRSSQMERVTYFQSAALKGLITSIWDERFGVVGVRKVWHQLLCDDVKIARCTVGRLLKAMGVESVRRGFCLEIAWWLTGCRIRLPPGHFLLPQAASIFVSLTSGALAANIYPIG